MRKRNPVYEKTRWTLSRSKFFLGGILGVAAVMTLFALAVFTDMIGYMRERGQSNFAQMLQMYFVLGVLECLLVLAIAPALSGVSVAGERERGMYDSMRVSGISAVRLVSGKCYACMNIMAVLIVAGFPALFLVYVYGGVRLQDAVYLGLTLMVISFYVSSAGMLCSAFVRRPGRAVTVSYTVMLFLSGGTVLIHYLPSLLFVSEYGSSIGSPIAWFHYLLLLNPLLTFYCVLDSQAGSGEFLFSFINLQGNYRPNWVTEHWIMVSMALISILSVLSLILCCIRINADRRTAKDR